MPRRLLLSIIVVLIITNVMTLIFWNKNKDDLGSAGNIQLDGDNQMHLNSNDPVATIGSEEISYADWNESTRNTHGERHLKTMIDRLIVKQLSEQERIEIDEKVIEKEIHFLTTMQGVKTEEEIEKLESGWREDIIYRYELETLLTQDTEIPEEEIRSYFDMYKGQYNFDSSIQASHIIVDSSEIAEKVIEELEQGASFDLLAQEYSKDGETKEDGGYLGFLVEGSQFYPRGYAEIINNMEENSYSEPFKVGGDVAIVYLHRYLPEITFTYDEIKPYIENELALNEMEQTLTAKPLWERLNIEWIFEE